MGNESAVNLIDRIIADAKEAAAKVLADAEASCNSIRETTDAEIAKKAEQFERERAQQTKAVISGNHIEGSLWGVTIIGCQDVNLGCLNEGENYNPGGNVFKNNGNNGELYDLYNNSTLTVYAQNNTWNVSEQTKEQIESVIFHKHDNASLGEVIFMPAANTTGIKGITVDKKNDSIFDLQGRKTTATQKGIYIVNGKKVVR